MIAPFFFQLAKAEKLKPMELELKKLEDLAEAIVSDFAYMKSREKLMRDTNGKMCYGLIPTSVKNCYLSSQSSDISVGFLSVRMSVTVKFHNDVAREVPLA